MELDCHIALRSQRGPSPLPRNLLFWKVGIVIRGDQSITTPRIKSLLLSRRNGPLNQLAMHGHSPGPK